MHHSTIISSKVEIKDILVVSLGLFPKKRYKLLSYSLINMLTNPTMVQLQVQKKVAFS